MLYEVITLARLAAVVMGGQRHGGGRGEGEWGKGARPAAPGL